ncbi:MAG TPA: glycogen synthase GlgA [Bryobacteraceae bacterium]|nr:glycogen synthase GlgA [Bryobacteraceae bacterium]
MPKILMVASEAAPYAKSGGLADVVGALPEALRVEGCETAVLLPRYRAIPLKSARRVYDHLPVWLGSARYDVAVYQASAAAPFYFLDCPPLFDRAGLYGENGADYPDNHIRFAVLARAALAVARHLFRPDIFHCHDWQSGLVPAYLRTTFSTDPTVLAIKTLFTIHNLGYQGLFPRSVLPEIALDARVFHPDGMEFYGMLSYIKGGLFYSDALNTVSPTYAREIQTPAYGFGLDGVLRARSQALCGILNGVDYREWNPETDALLPANYSARDLSGKQVCKQHLVNEFGLQPEAMERPLLGIVSRFTEQKGADLLEAIGGRLAQESVYLVALGSGEPEHEDVFRGLAAAWPGRIGVRIGYDNALAHRIQAGADMFLVPSRYEPCGLTQMYSLKYGAVPVVRATGGLDDTIEDGTGFKFWDYSPEALYGAIRAAVEAFGNPENWRAIMLRGMQKDFSWPVSASAYAALYRRLLRQP